MYYKIINSPVGKLILIEENEKLTNLLYYKDINFSNLTLKDTPLLLSTELQLKEYFEGKRKTFEIDLNLKGTDFQKKVWNELLKIPYGDVVSYKYIASKIGDDKASRAVGLANNKNPISIIIPCHRVIGSNKKLIGYAGGIMNKEILLNLEITNKNY